MVERGPLLRVPAIQDAACRGVKHAPLFASLPSTGGAGATVAVPCVERGRPVAARRPGLHAGPASGAEHAFRPGRARAIKTGEQTAQGRFPGLRARAAASPASPALTAARLARGGGGLAPGTWLPESFPVQGGAATRGATGDSPTSSPPACTHTRPRHFTVPPAENAHLPPPLTLGSAAGPASAT